MKRGLFVAFIYSNYCRNIGIINKLDSFIRSFNRIQKDLELEPLVIVPENFGMDSDEIELVTTPIRFQAPAAGYLDYMTGKFRSVLKFYNEVSRRRPEFIYLRYPVADFFLYTAVRILKSRFPAMKLVTEHQSKELLEVRALKKPIHFFLEYIFGKAIRNLADGMVGMSPSVTAYQKTQITPGTKKHILSHGNSVDIHKCFPRKSFPEYTGNELKIGFVGNLSGWHGMDRLIKSVLTYTGEMKVRLYLIGQGPVFDELKQSLEAQAEKRIVFMGKLTGERLDNFYCQVHIAISNLALHRMGLTDATPLKSREYMAKGIPYIIGYNDPDIPPEFPFVLRVRPDDSKLSIKRLFDFYESIYESDFSTAMVKLATKKMSFEVKNRKLAEFIKNLVR